LITRETVMIETSALRAMSATVTFFAIWGVSR
jgi:hypothetical protein